MRRRSASRAGERGFTLVEVLVSLAILSIVGTVLGVVFSIGMRTLLFPGASQDRLGAASYAIAIEQPLTEDVQRASCIQLPSDQDGGTCDAGTFQGLCSAGSLCIGWPDLVHPDQCDMALYAVSANPVYRQEWQGLELKSDSYNLPRGHRHQPEPLGCPPWAGCRDNQRRSSPGQRSGQPAGQPTDHHAPAPGSRQPLAHSASLALRGHEHQPVLTRRPRRRAEEGQVLIMALAFIAFFGLVTAALLQLADTVELQQSHGQSAANANAAAEGGMFFAAEAAAQQGSCDAKATIGPITMMGSDDSASVTTNACNPGATADLLADQCAVCVLGPYGPSQSPSLSVSGTLTVQGPIAVSGDATSGTTTIGAADTQSTVGGSGFIGCSGTCSGDYLPSNTATLTQPPSATAEPPTLNCQTFQPPLVFTSPTPIAGCYSSLSLDCSGTGGVACTYPLAGLVEVDGLLTIGTAAGPETTVSNPSSSYAALALVPVPRSAGSGGSLLINADGALDLQGLAVTGDVALYVDPSDHVGPLDALRVGGGSLSVSGTVYAPTASVNVFGGPGAGTGTLNVGPDGADQDSGRLIVGSLTIGQQAGHGVVTVNAEPPPPGYCWVYSDSVTVTAGAQTASGQVMVESDCSGEAGVGIISINFGS